MTFTEKIKDLINLIDNWLLDPKDNTQLIQWKYSAEYLAYTFEFNDTEQIYIDKIISMYEEQFEVDIEQKEPIEQKEEQIKENNFNCLELTWDLYGSLPEDLDEETKSIFHIKTYYEKLFTSRGHVIKYCKFKLD
jgi:3-dehydroquinate dehydratase